MPFRRKPKTQKAKTHKPRAPRVPKAQQLARPKVKDLRMIYKGIMTASIQNRLSTLAYVMQWYDNAIPYIIQKGMLAQEFQKHMEIATKCRKQAMGTNVDHEKESAYLMAIRRYEKVCASLKPQEIDKVLAEYNARKPILEAKQAKLEQRYGLVPRMLQTAIGNRVKIEVADAVKAVQYNPSLTTISYNREAVQKMTEKFRQEGLLPVFIEQLEVLSRHAALTSDGNGGLIYNADDQIKISIEMLNDFVRFAKTIDAPKKLVKTGQVITQAPQAASATVAPRAPRQLQKGPKVGGKYAPGSALAVLFQRLQDEQSHDRAQSLAGLPCQNAEYAIKSLAKDGPQYGWEIKDDGTTLQAILSDALRQQVQATP